MRPMISGLCAVVLATPAFAQPLTGLFAWQVSADRGATWSSSITLNPGDPYRIRGVASWTSGTGPAIGIAGATFEQIDLIGANSSDIFGGASGPGGLPTYLKRMQGVSETWSIQTGTGASEGSLKIDNILTTGSSTRTNFGQLPYILGGGGIPNPAFTRENPIVMFDMNATAGAPKVLTVSATWTRLGTPASNEFKVYTTETGTNKKPVEEAVLTNAVVTIIPAPATLPALAALTLLRRRR